MLLTRSIKKILAVESSESILLKILPKDFPKTAKVQNFTYDVIAFGQNLTNEYEMSLSPESIAFGG